MPKFNAENRSGTILYPRKDAVLDEVEEYLMRMATTTQPSIESEALKMWLELRFAELREREKAVEHSQADMHAGA